MKTAAVLVAAAAQCFGAADEMLRAGGKNDAIRARLEACLPAAGAMACYEETLWAACFFEGLIEAVYTSDKDEQAFRRDWFVDCVGRLP